MYCIAQFVLFVYCIRRSAFRAGVSLNIHSFIHSYNKCRCYHLCKCDGYVVE